MPFSTQGLALLASFFLAASLFLTGCAGSDFRDRKSDYGAAEAAQYVLPDDFPQQDALPIPASELVPQARSREVPRPEPMSWREVDAPLVEKRQEAATQDEVAGDTWLLVRLSPAEVWPGLEAFVAQPPRRLVASDPRRGEIRFMPGAAASVWQLNLRQGVRRETAEVRLQPLAESAATSALSVSAPLEALQGFLATYLEASQAVSQRAQALHQEEQLRWVERDGRRLLAFRLDYHRLWSEMSRLLEEEFVKANQKLIDLNRDEGRFYLRYVPRSQRSSGFWSSLLHSEPAPDEHLYQLHLQRHQEELLLVVETEPGQAAPAVVEEELLRWLERQLR